MNKNLKSVATTLLELAGVGLIVWGLWLWMVPVALIAAGAACIGMSYMWTRGVADECSVP
ncbi:hypothetical protein IT882_04345 [Microbacterium schleiferi]|uniref:Uncharacterized protein n=1 Tax=Microbacterium schleiferi TaxID=69362 RepID=A0A7S8MY21_9MICO|nr:hypothetical protein [Microbacterium schleiferi]QPE05304.1 hypothetical protein IT882_04345 [Microbacterium schleiferi]